MNRGRGRGFEFREGHYGALLWVTRVGFMIVPSAALIPSASRTDEAIAHLRMRYARGEIGRDEYLRTATDLGVSLPPDTPSACRHRRRVSSLLDVPELTEGPRTQ